MESLEKFLLKINEVRVNPNLNNLKTIVSDIWAWTDLNTTANPNIKAVANEVEDVIANAIYEERNLNSSELDFVKSKLQEISSLLEAYIN